MIPDFFLMLIVKWERREVNRETIRQKGNRKNFENSQSFQMEKILTLRDFLSGKNALEKKPRC